MKICLYSNSDHIFQFSSIFFSVVREKIVYMWNLRKTPQGNYSSQLLYSIKLVESNFRMRVFICIYYIF